LKALVDAADSLGRLTARVVPSSFAIAVLLTGLTALMALGWAHATPLSIVAGWGDGFWELLAFSMQMALIMFSGYLLALSRPVRRLLEWLASFATTPRSAVVLMAVVSMGLAYLNWGLSIVASAMLVRFVVRRQPQVDYRLLVACAYFGLGATWHAGLSASAPLLVATPDHFLVKRIGVIPVADTLFSPFNLIVLGLAVVLLTVLAWALHPPPERTVRVDPALLERGAADFEPPPRPGDASLATRLDHGRALPWAFGAAGAVWLVLHFARTGAAGINLNVVNFAFLMAAIVLHGTPASLIAASEQAAGVLAGIVLQFPLYAGIYGIFRSTGLADRIGEAFVSVASARTFPFVVYLYSGVVNYFVPSGGSKWAIEAPYLLDAAQRLGVPPAKIVLAYAWGDMATDLIQPFWAIPLLAVARIEFKEVLGFLLTAFLFYLPLVAVAFLLAG
jgi:short-chain fatty acids transporter